MRTPESLEVKDVYSPVHLDALRRKEQGNQMQPPNFNDFQLGGKGLSNQDSIDDKDLQYQFGKDFMLDPAKISKGIVAPEANSKSKIDESPLSALLHPEDSKSSKKLADAENCKPAVAEEPYYHEPDSSSASLLEPLNRLVHLDLKGAPPKMSYYRELFPLLMKLGATGLLIEYEDMFPYSGDLKNISAANSYSLQDVEEILALANKSNLFVIPIIQTFGHMEFVLKSLHLKDLRESDYTPQVINVASKRSYDIIRGMVRQVLAAHPSATYLHIGCDEVYEIGRGKSADIMIREKIKTEHVFLRHVNTVAQIVAEESNGKVRPIIWDDELRNIEASVILESGIPSKVDIMVWKYTPNISKALNESLWDKYGKLFQSVWAASSFKGATGARQIYTEVEYHIQNHFSWIETMVKYRRKMHFKGIVLTGWSRYDHFATLCELLPVAIPSLAVCLATLSHGGFNKDIHRETSKLLNCNNKIEMSFPALDPKTKKAKVTQDCRFPGHMLYYGMQELWGCRQQGQEAKELGWLSEYQISHRFSNPGQLKVMARKLGEQHSNILKISKPLQNELGNIYFDDVVEEWMDENIYEQIRHIKATQEKIRGLFSEIHWERRPLKGIARIPAGVKIDLNSNALSPQQGRSHVSEVQENSRRGQPEQFEMRNSRNTNNLKQSLQGVQDNLNQATNLKNSPFTSALNVFAQRPKLAADAPSSQGGKNLNTLNLSGQNIHGPDILSRNVERKPIINRNSGIEQDMEIKKPVLPNNQNPAISEEVLSRAGEHKSNNNMHNRFFASKRSEIFNNNARERDIPRDNFESRPVIHSQLLPSQDLARKENPLKHDIVGNEGIPPMNNGLRGMNRVHENENKMSDSLNERGHNPKDSVQNVQPEVEKRGEFHQLVDEKLKNILLDHENSDDGKQNDKMLPNLDEEFEDEEDRLDETKANINDKTDDKVPYEDKGGLSPGFVEAVRKAHARYDAKIHA